jgi:hypothetical protein
MKEVIVWRKLTILQFELRQAQRDSSVLQRVMRLTLEVCNLQVAVCKLTQLVLRPFAPMGKQMRRVHDTTDSNMVTLLY